jgi:hypothetical protein
MAAETRRRVSRSCVKFCDAHDRPAQWLVSGDNDVLLAPNLAKPQVLTLPHALETP